MVTVDLEDAKAQLPGLLARGECGENVVIARAGRPAVRLVPVVTSQRVFGTMAMTVPDEFFAPLPQDELAGWE